MEMTNADQVRICTPKELPADLNVKAAATAAGINPVNAPFGPAAAGLSGEEIAVLTSKYWGVAGRRLKVTFLEPIALNLRRRILSHMNSWYTGGANIRFTYTADPGAQVRVTREGDGYWSYLGTDVGLIPQNEPTMSLQGFSMTTPDSEFFRVVRHETGHTMGFPHEHMRKELVARIDPAKAYPYFLRTQGWDKTTVDQQVLTPLDDVQIMATPPDQTSIMCYQLPGSIMKDGQPILGGNDINNSDLTFAAKIYPKSR
jgi:hypothetical protein